MRSSLRLGGRVVPRCPIRSAHNGGTEIAVNAAAIADVSTVLAVAIAAAFWLLPLH